MKQSYPELETDFDRISQIAYAEEEAFRRTLAAGTTILDTAVARAKQSGGADARRATRRSAARHLRLPDRPHPGDGRRAGPAGRRDGLPPADDRAAPAGQGRREGRRRPGTRDTDGVRATCGAIGRDRLHRLPASSPPRPRVVGLVVDGETVTDDRAGPATVEVVLDRTPFYAESGGQVADEGVITADGVRAGGARRPAPGQGPDRAHRRGASSGALRTGRARCSPRSTASGAISACQAHSGTHVVHAALRQVLGPTALQSGSYNKPGYLRLDFALGPALSPAHPQRDRGGRQPRGAQGPARVGRPTCRCRRPARSAPWRCSARRTARTCASSRSAARGRASCAVAPTCSTPARSARSP